MLPQGKLKKRGKKDRDGGRLKKDEGNRGKGEGKKGERGKLWKCDKGKLIKGVE